MFYYYTYLIASLPVLQFGSPPPFSFEEFLQICSRSVSQRHIDILKRAVLTDELTAAETKTLFTPLEKPRAEARGKNKESSAFSNGVNAPYESFLTGFAPEANVLAVEREWYRFETGLRNELSKIRAVRRHEDPERYLRKGVEAEADIARVAMNAYRNPSILGAEKMLDEARWRKLDELAVGHYFDIDFLVVYAYKLLILQRWEKVRIADKPRVLEAVVGEASRGVFAESKRPRI